MRFKTTHAFAVALAVALLPGRAALCDPQGDLKSVLERLNASAANFHSIAADGEYDVIESDPLPDTDVQKGVFYFERKNNTASAGVHFDTHNGKPSGKAYTYVGGVFKLFEPGVNQVTTHAGAARFESYIILGFGASGRDLEARWDIKYLGTESLSDGKAMVSTAKLELVAKDPAVRKTIPKVTIWVDPERAVSLRQVFVLSTTSTWDCRYTNLRLNQPLPADAFTFKTNRQTVYQTQ